MEEEYKQKLKEKNSKIILALEELNKIHQAKGLYTLIERYRQVDKIINAEISNNSKNPIKGSVRAYLEIFSDYENPLLKDLYDLEKEIDIYLDSK